MKIVTILFTYNRPVHTGKVLDALSKNTILPEKLFIFHDGKKDSTNTEDWNAVEDVIHGVCWCDCECITSEFNKGLADSVVYGVTTVLKDYDAVIVLEDDCVPHPQFMEYMTACLNIYCENKEVYSVSGYAYPIDVVSQYDSDVYAVGRVSSLGWGTWKDRWSSFKRDYTMLTKMKKDEILSRRLAIWGSDLETMCIANLKGQIDSWAVFWALDAIYKEKICINPYFSLITNIGYDGSGVHSGDGGAPHIFVEERKDISFKIPRDIKIEKRVEIAFSKLYGSLAAVLDYDDHKEDVVIYGCGRLYEKHKNEIALRYNVAAFIDNQKKGFYEGKRLMKISEAGDYLKYKIIIAIIRPDEIDFAKKSLEDIGKKENIYLLDELI